MKNLTVDQSYGQSLVEKNTYAILPNLPDAAWVCPTNAALRFFKVKVEMP